MQVWDRMRLGWFTSSEMTSTVHAQSHLLSKKTLGSTYNLFKKKRCLAVELGPYVLNKLPHNIYLTG